MIQLEFRYLLLIYNLWIGGFFMTSFYFSIQSTNGFRTYDLNHNNGHKTVFGATSPSTNFATKTKTSYSKLLDKINHNFRERESKNELSKMNSFIQKQRAMNKDYMKPSMYTSLPLNSHLSFKIAFSMILVYFSTSFLFSLREQFKERVRIESALRDYNRQKQNFIKYDNDEDVESYFNSLEA